MKANDATRSHGAAGDPYRIFFPLGVLLGVGGVSIWLVYWLGITAGYSGRAHAFVQTEGFLYSFVAGFLLTAVPRFTGTSAPARRTQYLLAAALAAASVAFGVQAFLLGHVLFLIVHAAVIGLAAQRVRRRRSSPPEGFALVGVGLGAGAGAALVNVGVASGWVGPEWDLLGRRMLTEGMVLLLVLGVGGFLGPRLLGFAALPQFQQVVARAPKGPPPLFAGRRAAVYGAAGVAVVASIVAEYAFGAAAMAALRAAVATALIFGTIKPWKVPAVRTTLAWCVWAAHLFVIGGLWLVALAPAYRVDLLHVVFMGAFTLLILAVAMRVTLSHGGHALSHEQRSWPLRIGIATGLLALLARVGAAFAPDSFFDYLALAAALWIGGIAFWATRLLQFIRRAR